jgi:uncharacterized membrane protein YfcA
MIYQRYREPPIKGDRSGQGKRASVISSHAPAAGTRAAYAISIIFLPAPTLRSSGWITLGAEVNQNECIGMSTWYVVWPGMLLLGAVLGFCGGLLGIGGGILAIPVLALWFGMDQSVAQGTALVMIAPNVVMAFWRYSQHHPIALKLAASLGLISILVSYPAARLAVSLDNATLRWIFIGFLLWLIAYLSWQLYARHRNQRQPAGGQYAWWRVVAAAGV